LPALADTARTREETFRRIISTTEVRVLLPEGSADDRRFRFNGRTALLMLLVADCVRYGMKAPQAGRIVGGIAERLTFDPGASHVHIEFHENGASFTFTSDESPDAASAAGPARFKLTFDLGAYRAVIDATLAERAAAMGSDDVE
jgi:hypothetical protein